MCQGSSNVLKILNSIEDLRIQLHQTIGEGRSLQDPQVIQKSQELDTLLNRFYKLYSNSIS